uniref:Response regulatory domain-containing protein n=1 Tax=Leersia perrieri TaxID=77586 RepID=A0A0D9WE52_9ORYZ
MAQNKEGYPTDRLNVMVIDEDECHAYSTSSMLSQFNYCATVYTSPIKSLKVLENHAQDFDLVLTAVHMEELDGLTFLTSAREFYRSIQVIMMSTETTMHTMKRCVNLGARFLVNKPLDVVTAQNIWQHLDRKVLSIEKIKCLLQDASPKNKKVVNNVGTIDRNQIPNVQVLKIVYKTAYKTAYKKHRCPNFIPLKLHKRYKNHQLDMEKDMQEFTGNTEICNVYTTIRRSLQLGAIFDEFNYPSDHCGKDYKAGEDEIVGGHGCVSEANATQSNDDHQVVVPVLPCNVADASQEIMNKTTIDNQQASRRSDKPTDLSADEATVISTGNMQINVAVAYNAYVSQESIKNTTSDDLNNHKGSKEATFRLVNYSDSESDDETEAS